MPKLTIRNPKYRKHRASGQAIVTINGRDFYLGPWRSTASRAEYDRLIAEYLAAGRTRIDRATSTVAELLNAYRVHCEKTYAPADGSRNEVSANIKAACRPLRRLYGETPAAEFGPLRFKAVIAEYIRLGWCRKNINRHIGRVKGFFRWAVGNELVPPSVYHGLLSIAGLRHGRTDAAESEPVKPVALASVDAVRPFVSRQVAAMIDLQLATGMRPGEVVIMRGVDIDRTGPTWLYAPAKHKTMHHGINRMIYLGPIAQSVLKPFLKPDADAYLFSPADAEAERREKLHQARKTPLSCGNKPGSNRRRRPARVPGLRYTRESYTRAIWAACCLAFPYPDGLEDENRAQWRRAHFWSPNQLRHTAATKIRKAFGAEASQVILGHTQLRTTEIYAERNAEAAMKIMANIG